MPPGFALVGRQINFEAGFVGYVEGRPFFTLSFEMGAGRIQGIQIVNNPDKLTRVPPMSCFSEIG